MATMPLLLNVSGADQCKIVNESTGLMISIPLLLKIPIKELCNTLLAYQDKIEETQHVGLPERKGPEEKGPAVVASADGSAAGESPAPAAQKQGTRRKEVGPPAKPTTYPTSTVTEAPTDRPRDVPAAHAVPQAMPTTASELKMGWIDWPTWDTPISNLHGTKTYEEYVQKTKWTREKTCVATKTVCILNDESSLLNFKPLPLEPLLPRRKPPKPSSRGRGAPVAGCEAPAAADDGWNKSKIPHNVSTSANRDWVPGECKQH